MTIGSSELPARVPHYPLAHRLLSRDEFKLNAQWESVLSFPGETSAMLQTHTGIGLDDAFVLTSQLKLMADSPRITLVSGRGLDESWDEVSASKLHPMFRQFRSILSSQLDTQTTHNAASCI